MSWKKPKSLNSPALRLHHHIFFSLISCLFSNQNVICSQAHNIHIVIVIIIIPILMNPFTHIYSILYSGFVQSLSLSHSLFSHFHFLFFICTYFVLDLNISGSFIPVWHAKMKLWIEKVYTTYKFSFILWKPVCHRRWITIFFPLGFWFLVFIVLPSLFVFGSFK